ncbi:hypothetical protein BX600DRAFT_456120 [Xylariales sp. PMI_506]|nr:hypothetical protein BX600DRAFT_456120 [Xylariales sp. PMI_506]
MSPPRRRSARLASSSRSSKASSVPRLGSVTEGDETPCSNNVQNLDAIMSSPLPQPTTPASATPIKLPMSEMHPSKVHQTTAAPSSGLRLGFTDINTDPKSRDRPSGASQVTPSKTPLPASPFTFRVGRQNIGDMELGPEAKRIMEELRGEAAKIKAQLKAERDQQRLDEAANQGRKIATAKGKANRFSDVHMAEFKKMDSIENHPSAFRVTPGRITPARPGIKRSQSKANLDEPEPFTRKTPSVRQVPKSAEKLREEPEPAVKRVKQRVEDDASTTRPVSRDGASSIPRPKSSGNDSMRSGIPRSQSIATLMTPTKASAAKTSSSKTPMANVAKSASKPDLSSLAKTPVRNGLDNSVKTPSKHDFSSLIRSPSRSKVGGTLKKAATFSNIHAAQKAPTLVQTPGRFDRVKSILKRQFSASKPKSHLPIAGSNPKTPSQTQKHLLVPMTTPGQKFGKHVEFTPDTKQATMTQNSPSPTKPSERRNGHTPQPLAPIFPSFAKVLSAKKDKGDVTYPDLSAYSTGSDDEESTGKPEPLPESVPGSFTFRSDHTICFRSVSPNGFGAAPGQSSLRQVRRSIALTSRMPGAYPTGSVLGISSPNKENNDPGLIPGIPHGMSNKKRHRATWEDDELKTGIAHGLSNKKRHRASSDAEEEEDEGAQRAAKKLRKEPPAEKPALAAPKLYSSPVKSPLRKEIGISRTPSPQKKKTGGISLSRLNLLARPKNRN